MKHNIDEIHQNQPKITIYIEKTSVFSFPVHENMGIGARILNFPHSPSRERNERTFKKQPDWETVRCDLAAALNQLFQKKCIDFSWPLKISMCVFRLSQNLFPHFIGLSIVCPKNANRHQTRQNERTRPRWNAGNLALRGNKSRGSDHLPPVPNWHELSVGWEPRIYGFYELFGLLSRRPLRTSKFQI